MIFRRLLILVYGLAFLSGGFLRGQEQNLTPEQIIQKVAEKEDEFRKIWQQYAYRQNITFEIVAPGDLVRERREMAIEVVFTNDGKRETQTVLDRGRLVSLGITPEDISDIVSRQPFVLTPDELPKYDINFVGKETIDELDLYVFEVAPKKIKKPDRYFQGKIYVDDQDLQIVMTRGKIVPDYKRNHFPEFETIREQVDGQYWFPTWTLADDYIFGKHLRQLVTYENFKRYQVGTSITYGDVVEPPDEKKPPEKPKKPPL